MKYPLREGEAIAKKQHSNELLFEAGASGLDQETRTVQDIEELKESGRL